VIKMQERFSLLHFYILERKVSYCGQKLEIIFSCICNYDKECLEMIENNQVL